MNLQAQLASLKELAAQSFSINGSTTENPNDRFCGKLPSYPPQDHVETWSFQPENLNMSTPQFNQSMTSNIQTMPYYENGLIMNQNSAENYANSLNPAEENFSFSSFEEASHSMDSFDDFQSMAFGYVQHS